LFCTARVATQSFTLSLHDALPIFDQAVRVADRQVLAAAVGMVDQGLLAGPARPHGLLERVEHELGLLRRAGPPADDSPGEHVDRSEEHTSELQSRENLVCRLLLEK